MPAEEEKDPEHPGDKRELREEHHPGAKAGQGGRGRRRAPKEPRVGRERGQVPERGGRVGGHEHAAGEDHGAGGVEEEGQRGRPGPGEPGRPAPDQHTGEEAQAERHPPGRRQDFPRIRGTGEEQHLADQEGIPLHLALQGGVGGGNPLAIARPRRPFLREEEVRGRLAVVAVSPAAQSRAEVSRFVPGHGERGGQPGPLGRRPAEEHERDGGAQRPGGARGAWEGPGCGRRVALCQFHGRKAPLSLP